MQVPTAAGVVMAMEGCLSFLYENANEAGIDTEELDEVCLFVCVFAVLSFV